MRFFNIIRSIRRPRLGFSRDGRFFRWASKERDSEPNTFCETALASAEGGLVIGVDKFQKSRLRNWVVGAYLLLLAGLGIWLAFQVSYFGWIWLAAVVAGVVIVVIILAASYYLLRFAGKYLCPIGVKFSGS